MTYRMAARERRPYGRPHFWHVAYLIGNTPTFTIDGLLNATKYRETLRALVWEAWWAYAPGIKAAKPTWWEALRRWATR